MLGAEFNQVNKFIKSLYLGHSAAGYDVVQKINALSIPFNLRVHVGQRVRLFIEWGVFADIYVFYQKRGKMDTFFPTYLTGGNYFSAEPVLFLNGGPSSGCGISLPLFKHALLLKADYKYGARTIIQPPNELLPGRYFRWMIAYSLQGTAERK